MNQKERFKHGFRRILSAILVLAMVFAMVPVPGFAAESQEQAQVDANDISIQGTNGFGNLLSDAITQEQESDAQAQSEYEAGYSVTDLEITDNLATVTYDALEEAILIVALYSEDGLQMLASGKTTVSPEATTATVTIAGTMPAYFMAAAYLVDTYDFSPLCDAYDTPMYTQEMQELLASTVHDYDPDRILNLDQDETTNFAVFAESTKVIDQAEGRNIVASANDEILTYVIENADEQFTSLQVGDVVAYPYGENDILIAKVAAITVDGTTVTITGAELEMEEAFAAVKIEGNDDTDDMIVDEGSIEEGFAYEGITASADLSQVIPAESQGDLDFGKSAAFKVEKNLGSNIKLTGSLNFSLNISLDYYVSLSRQYLEFRVEKGVSAALNATGKFQGEWTLCNAAFYPVPGISIGIKPTFKVDVSAELEFSIAFRDTSGYTFENKRGMKPLSSTTKCDPNIKVEGTFIIGFDLQPQVEILEGKLASFTVNMPVELEINVSNTGNSGTQPSEQDESFHNCTVCLDIKPFLKVKISVKLQLLELEKLTYEKTLRSLKIPLSHFYFSLDNAKLGVGVCPDWSYRLTVSAMDGQGDAFEGAVISVASEQGKSNGYGTAIFFLPRAVHSVTCDFGDSSLTKKVALDRAKKLSFTEGETPPPENSFDEDLEFGTEDDSLIIAYGECGSDATWVIYGSGRMVISGSGDVTSKSWGEYRDYITVLEVENGITSICASAFSGATNLRKLILADSVASLGLNAFNGCTGLVDVTMPCDVAISVRLHYNDHQSSFTGCTGVQRIRYTHGRTGIMPNRANSNYNYADHYEFTLEWKCRGSLQSITFDEGVTHIGDYAFLNCTSLTEAEIPSTVDSFGHYAFSGCKSLRNIKWPEKIVFLGAGVFQKCETFTEIDIPDTVTRIYENTFSGCIGLTAIEIPDSVTTLGLNAFNGCTGLTSVTMPCDIAITARLNYNDHQSSFTDCTGVRKIRYTYGRTGIMPNRADSNYNYADHYEFTLEWKCRGSLQSITFDEGITHIGDYAFLNCTSLTEAVIPSTVDSFGHYAFSGCKSLKNISWPEEIVFLGAGAFRACETFTQIDIPDTLTTIYENTFSGCIGLTAIEIPDSVTTLGLNAFNGCTGLKEVTMPCDITITVKKDNNHQSSFTGCNNVRTIHYTYGRTGIMPNRTDTNYNYKDHHEFTLEWKSRDRLGTVIFDEGITQIGNYAFFGANRLNKVTLPSTLDTVGDYSFADCSALAKLTFSGDVPFFSNNSFRNDILTCYYPADNDTWTEYDLRNYGGTINWVAYTLDENGDMITNGVVLAEEAVEELEELPEEVPQQTGAEVLEVEEQAEPVDPQAIYGGEYSTEIVDGYTLKTASFKGLVPGEQYLLLALKSIEVEDPLTADNLLYVDQGQALEDGTLVFTYVPRETVNVSYVVACGPSNKNLKDAVITFPEMTADGELQTVNPTVVYDGETLTEGVDYIIEGTASFTAPGTYTCYIRGIRNYTGMVECTYTVEEPEEPPVQLGDADGNGVVNPLDALLILKYYTGTITEDKLNVAACEVDGNGVVNPLDALWVLKYYTGVVIQFPVEG